MKDPVGVYDSYEIAVAKNPGGSGDYPIQMVKQNISSLLGLLLGMAKKFMSDTNLKNSN